MSKYEELAILAVEDSRVFFEDQLACSNCAVAAITHLAKYLDAPGGSIYFVELNRDLVSTRKKAVRPHLVFSAEGVWHFAVEIEFGIKGTVSFQMVTLYIRIFSSGSDYTIRFDRDFNVNPANSDTFNDFSKYVYSSIKDDYRKPRVSRRKSIGFIHDPS